MNTEKTMYVFIASEVGLFKKQFKLCRLCIKKKIELENIHMQKYHLNNIICCAVKDFLKR